MNAILDLAEVRERVHRWTVSAYRRGESIPCACVEDGTVPVSRWFAP